MARIGIMQGRLVPPEADRLQCFPRKGWRSEFALARAAGLDAIEWIYDLFGEDMNPLLTDSGICEMKALSQEQGVAVVSLCADYFMERPLLRSTAGELSENIARLEWLLTRCGMVRIERMVLPFVEESSIGSKEDENRLVSILQHVLPRAQENKVELHLETSLAPIPFARLLEHIPSSAVKVNYDCGNSSSLGYDPAAEFAAYGSRIGSVHIKDRMRGGGTVPLGSGSADLAGVFSGLTTAGYRGDFILQVARGAPNQEVEWARQNRAFVVEQLHEASNRLSWDSA